MNNLERWCKANNQIVFDGWDNKLFHRSYQEIEEYLIYRFRNTTNIIEYYACMANLRRSGIEKSLLYVFYEDSPQHKGINTLTLENPLIGTHRNSLLVMQHSLNGLQKRSITIRR